MSIKHLEKSYLQLLLKAFWQDELGTKKDPANGKWYETGAQGDGGLYGAVKDADDIKIILDEDHKKLERIQSSVINSYLDNSQSNVDTELSTQLSYTFLSSETHTKTTSHNIKFAIGYEIKATAGIIFTEVEEKIKVNFEYQYSTSKTDSETSSSSSTISHIVKLTVPAGKIYKASLVGTVQKVSVPFTALVEFNGTTGTWFESRVNGHYHWISSIGQAFKQINAKRLAGNDSNRFTSRGIEDKGIINNTQQFDFKVIITDVTDQINNTLIDDVNHLEKNIVEIIEVN